MIAENRSTGRQNVIGYNTIVRIKLKKSEVLYKGGFTSVSDSTIGISGLEFQIQDIESISVYKNIAKISGGLVIGVGIIGLIQSGINKKKANSYDKGTLQYAFANSIAGTYAVLGSVVTILGGVLVNGYRKYTSKQYEFKIVLL